MTLEQIKKAVDAGKTVHWANDLYRVIPSGLNDGKYLIQCDTNGFCTGLTTKDGKLNEDESKFYIEKPITSILDELDELLGGK